MFLLSFCDPGRPSGEQFLGASVVLIPAALVRDDLRENMITAVKVAHAMKCNPGGEVRMMLVYASVEAYLLRHREWLFRVLTREEVDRMNREVSPSSPN